MPNFPMIQRLLRELGTESSAELEIQGAAGDAGKLTLSSAELTVVDGDELGRIDFQAPRESSGTDAILVSAAIYAEADDTFSASVNDTDLVFATGKSELAAEKMRLDSDGNLGINCVDPGALLEVRADAAAPGVLRLSTAETTNVDGDILGRLEFQAPLDAAGTDAILVAASIWAEADATFSASVNTTDLVFACAVSETAAEKMRLLSNGTLQLDKTTADEPFLNLKATIDADATSAISSLTTSGAVTHHIQVELNGTTAWIPCSTTDPS